MEIFVQFSDLDDSVIYFPVRFEIVPIYIYNRTKFESTNIFIYLIIKKTGIKFYKIVY